MLWLLRLLRMFCELLPPVGADLLARGLGWSAYQLGIRRGLIRTNMAGALGFRLGDPALERLVRANYRHHGRVLIELMRLRAMARRGELARVPWIHPERLDGTHPGGQIVLTAHQGNMVLAAAAAAARGIDLAVVIKRVRNRGLERFWVEQFACGGVTVLFNRDSMGDILRVLRRGGTLGFVYDQHDSRGGVWVDFLGRPACCFRALPVLAERSPEPVVPAFTFRRADGRHLVYCERPIAFRDLGDPEANVRHHAQRYSDRIAAAVRRHPDQWLWLHKRWKPWGADASFTPRAAALVDASD